MAIPRWKLVLLVQKEVDESGCLKTMVVSW